MIVAARQFTNAAEMMAAAAAVHARCFKPRVKPQIRPALAAEAPPAARPKLVQRTDVPNWARSTVQFDAHVDAYAAHRHIQAMVAAGRISVLAEPRKTIAEIVLETLENFPGVTIDEVRFGGQAHRITKARRACMYEARIQRPDKSFPEIGKYFGGRDHTTVLSAVRKEERLRAEA